MINPLCSSSGASCRAMLTFGVRRAEHRAWLGDTGPDGGRRGEFGRNRDEISKKGEPLGHGGFAGARRGCLRLSEHLELAQLLIVDPTHRRYGESLGGVDGSRA